MRDELVGESVCAVEELGAVRARGRDGQPAVYELAGLPIEIVVDPQLPDAPGELVPEVAERGTVRAGRRGTR